MRKRRQLTIDEAPNSSELERYLGRVRGDDGELVPKKKPRKRTTVSASVFGRTIAETEEMIRTRAWDGCAARHLVALYALMHLKTYGVEAVMSPSELHVATMRMGGFVRQAFGGDYLAAVAYYRWLWTREIGREQWCRKNGHERHTRIGFHLTLSGALISDYKLDEHRARQAGRQGSR